MPGVAGSNQSYATAQCLPGERATGGGYTHDNVNDDEQVMIDRDQPAASDGGTPKGWTVSAHDKSATSSFVHGVTVYVVCARSG